jgi:hypothetical protein
MIFTIFNINTYAQPLARHFTGMPFAFARFVILLLAMVQCLRVQHRRLVWPSSSILQMSFDKKEDIDAKQREFWSKQQDLVISEVSLKGKRLGNLEKTAETMLIEKSQSPSQQKSLLEEQEKRNTDAEQQTSRRTAVEELNDSTTKSSKKTPPVSRLIDLESIELAGRWEQREGNFVLRPRNETTGAIGVIHFIGGAFVGAAPHLTYRYLLETLCDAGYIIVATPYKLDFDYVKCADEILDRFDRVAVQLAREVGPLPVVGVGHSAGALLQTLITCLFPGAPRAGNVLVSFNNKEVKEAIPGFDELVVPIAGSILDDAPQSVQLRNAVGNLRASLDSTVDSIASSVVVPGFVQNEALPVLRQGLEILYQIPFVLRTINSGTRDFIPSPDETKVCMFILITYVR